MKHVHIIGICGTAMAGIAALAQDSGWRVTGSDSGIYPPMSTFLQERNLLLSEGFDVANLEPAPDLVVVGNTISRGNVELEAVLNRGLSYCSGAGWIHDHLLAGRHPVVVTGTHGKTTTSSMISWLWENAGWQPGFLIGGIPANFGQGVRFPGDQWVVMEGDEYDTAFFDKRPKFLHYRPQTLIIHNLEYDHADIYPDLESIRIQFRLLLRTVPGNGLILANGDEAEVEGIVGSSEWTPIVRYGLKGDYPFTAKMQGTDGRTWDLIREGETLFTVHWDFLGEHNVINGLAAAAAALSRGMRPEVVKAGLETFKGVARRLQVRYKEDGVTIYDDFAHHPTAIATTLKGVRAAVGKERIWAVMEPRSNTMRRRIHQTRLDQVLEPADFVVIARPAAKGLSNDEMLDVQRIADDINAKQPGKAVVVENGIEACHHMQDQLVSGDHVVVMSNGGFDGIHKRLADALAAR
ncbi:MAG: UDP-N-acetylmuramate:L-alanyl-gamma-D-glutamyl-meso-diaminopimelate ligase [Magnetococcales bacterium]|nr:UDP-N-acetylmuramate:L-alanyl-gamma-D-glutamyl-meso-diaminopimelate ligase [Magnetococcales bacterium]